MNPEPRSALVAEGTGTPAAAYTRERHLLDAYRRLLYHPDTDVEELMRTVWGPLTHRQMYGNESKDGRIDRLDHNLPDLITRLRWNEQAPLAELLDAGNLVGAIRYLLAQEWSLLKRETTRRAPKDDGHARAAGLGRISSENYGRLHPGYLFRLPEPKPVRPMLRPKTRRRTAPAWLKHAQLQLFA